MLRGSSQVFKHKQAIGLAIEWEVFPVEGNQESKAKCENNNNQKKKEKKNSMPWHPKHHGTSGAHKLWLSNLHKSCLSDLLDIWLGYVSCWGRVRFRQA